MILTSCSGYSDKEKAYYRNGYNFEQNNPYMQTIADTFGEEAVWESFKEQFKGVEDEAQYEKAFIEGFNDALSGKKCKY